MDPPRHDPMRQSLSAVLEALGEAVYLCQSLEQTIAYAIALAVEDAAGDLTGQAQQASLEASTPKTLGELIRVLEKALPVSQHEVEALRMALRLRNRLVHHWLTDNLESLKTASGREGACSRLRSASAALDIARSVVNEHVDAYMAKYGWSVESLKEDAERMWNLYNGDLVDDL